MNKDISKLLISLSKSKFRGSFHLNDNMINYCKDKGYLKIRNDAYDIINKRLKPAVILNDGKQTPTRRNSHPVFIAQHACGCCCRKCLEKIHKIKNNHELTDNEVNYIIEVIMTWIVNEVKGDKNE